MNSIFTIAFKDLRLVSRDKMGMFFMLAFPIMMGILFGMIGVSMSSGEPRTIPVSIVDLDQSDGSRMLLENLEKNESIQVHLLDEATARDRVRLGKHSAMIIIPEKYGETAGIFWAEEQPEIKILRDPSRAAEAAMLQGYLMEATGQLMGKRMQDPTQFRPQIQQLMGELDESDEPLLTKTSLKAMLGSLETFFDDWSKVQESARQEGQNEDEFELKLANINVETITREPSKRESLTKKIGSPWDISFPSSMLWGVLGTMAGFAISLVRENTKGTLLRLKTAPIARWQILGGKALACFIAALMVIAILTTIGFALGMRPKSYLMLIIASVSTALCFVGIMLIVSVIGKTEEAVGGAAWGANIMMAMFGGGMIPLAFMPDFFASISNFSPVKWAILSLEGAIWREFSWSEFATPILVLLAIGAVGGIAGAWLLNRRG